MINEYEWHDEVKYFFQLLVDAYSQKDMSSIDTLFLMIFRSITW